MVNFKDFAHADLETILRYQNGDNKHFKVKISIVSAYPIIIIG